MAFLNPGDGEAQRETLEASASSSPNPAYLARAPSDTHPHRSPTASPQLPSVCSAELESPTRPSTPRSTPVDPRMRDGVERRAFSPAPASATPASSHTTTRASSEASSDVTQERSRTEVTEPDDSAAQRETTEARAQSLSPVHASPARASSVLDPARPPAFLRQLPSVGSVSPALQSRPPFLQHHSSVPRVYSSVERSPISSAPPPLSPLTPPAFSATTNTSSEASTDVAQERSREAFFELGVSATETGVGKSVSRETESAGRVACFSLVSFLLLV
ncbi:hypothetical protein BV22DRAFT_608114 [Leucogyrophana mollusca]|uniref:Uncharacterized protein n=1 Tax=Leucogyrophana mollusca TaxID=85980 RepID=A0ACB8BBX7_9AGAM|nr:hypothetical protein BV22DRAFT_608114 [Leucogyrophana mollusca]